MATCWCDGAAHTYDPSWCQAGRVKMVNQLISQSLLRNLNYGLLSCGLKPQRKVRDE